MSESGYPDIRKGEFVDVKEPTQLGVDIMAGSLIKNAGGSIARTGGYIAGRADLVELCAYRLTTPGLGREVGATLGHSRELFMGIFSSLFASYSEKQIKKINKIVVRDTDFVRTPAMKIARNLNGNVKK